MSEKPNRSADMTSGCGCNPPEDDRGCCPPKSVPLKSSPLMNIRPTAKEGRSIQSAGPLAGTVDAALSRSDRLDAFRVRWGAGRMRSTVAPGLYALGAPDERSEVLVTANYKLTFDTLRSKLPGRNLWILVLDTAGVNVWCAAGKGSFGTEELVRRIKAVGLSERVTQRRIVVPQLGAPGVAAHAVRERTGFKVVYGPIKAADLPAFLDNGLKADPRMRRKDFPLAERFVLIPIELVQGAKVLGVAVLLFTLLGGLLRPGGFLDDAKSAGLLALFTAGISLFAGAVLTPTLLPFLPGRAFSVKSLPLGLGAAALTFAVGFRPDTRGILESSAWALTAVAVTAYLAMNFTGASTYTSLSGVKKEMKQWLPVQVGMAATGLVLWTVSNFV